MKRAKAQRRLDGIERGTESIVDDVIGILAFFGMGW